MKKRMFVAANWKMNKNLSEASEFLEKLDFHLHENNNQSSVIIFPPFIGLESLAGKFNSNNFYLGSQNFHYEESGAFTGEVSILIFSLSAGSKEGSSQPTLKAISSLL